MARMPRLVVPGYPHHVTQRGNRRQKTFFCDDDYRYYTELLKEYSNECETEVWAYCLMPNHVHLVLVPSEEDGLRATLGETHRRYTRHVNFSKGWRGHLWQERFHSFVMDEEHLLATVRYVERNPVVAKLCKKPTDWPWSSAKAHLKGVADGLVNVAPMLARVGDWRAYLTDTGSDAEENAAIARHSRTGRPLGDQDFVARLEAMTGRVLAPQQPGRKPVDKSK